CNLIEPLFETRFHAHSYANRVGKGTHRAVDQMQTYVRHYRYALRLDILRHFPSIDHAILKDNLFGVIVEPQVRRLISLILHSGAGVLADEYEMVYFPGDNLLARLRPRGLPIGNLTSQFWSNCYLNPLDWFVTRELGCSAYLRYVDDFALFSNSKQQLWDWLPRIKACLRKLRLTLHRSNAQVVSAKGGIPWLGFRVYATHRLLKPRNLINFRRMLKQKVAAYQEHTLTFQELDASVQGWINHVGYADTWGARRTIFDKCVF
ncbi:MAG: RNA-directed DNA polymerase, partial [Anaerolineales bacterium]|nr:RNA-directed DNA polymerase [Anaerolineales bacterium]